MRQFKPGQLRSGSLYPITASYALTASYTLGLNTGSLTTTASFNAFTASYTTGSFTGSFIGDGSQLTGIVSSKWTGSNPISRQSDVEITGSLRVQGNITGSLFGTASWANNAITASYITTAQTASYVTPLHQNIIMTGSLIVSGANGGINTANNKPFLFDNSGISRVDWGQGYLKDTNDIQSIDWENRLALDSNEATSIDWQTRLLTDSNFDTVLDWENKYLYGTSSVSDQILTQRTSTNSQFYPTIVDSSNALADYETIYTAPGITFNPATSGITAASFTGSLFGTASYASASDTLTVVKTGSNSAFFPLIVDRADASPTNLKAYTTSNISFNPNTGGITATSFTGFSFTGSLLGTASNSSFATTASFANITTSSSLAQTASLALRVSGSLTGSLLGTASFASTASFVQTAQTASYVLQAVSASFASTASFVQNAVSASYVLSSSYAVSASFASTAISSSYVLTASYSNTSTSASYAISASYVLSSSYAISASYVLSSSYATASSYAIYAETASFSDRTTQIDVYVLNQSGQNIAKGVVVRITGSNNSSDIPRIVTASYISDGNSANTLGITTTAIADGAEGYVITEGILKGIDTQAFTSGQLVYLGATGSIIGTTPVAPLHAVRLGEVIRHQSNNGSIYVRIDNGYELGELHDVIDNTTTSSYGDLLVKSGSAWINSKQLTGSYGLTGSLTATSFTGSLFGTSSWASNSITSSFITASNVIGTVTSASYAITASYALSSAGGGGGDTTAIEAQLWFLL